MDKLLNWSLAQNDPETAKKVGAPDPELLAKLFGAADDPTLMKESLIVIENPEADYDSKITALENFEMLIENLDNANNIGNMGMWENVINLLDHDELEFRRLTCSIIGTAVQNNEKTQVDFVKSDDGVDKLIKLAKSDDTRQKALYALSNVIRNHPMAYKQFEQGNGWELIPLLSCTDKKIQLRSVSLLSSIISCGLDIEDHLHQYQVVTKVLSIDDSLIDKTLAVIVSLIQVGYKFTQEELSLIKSKVDVIERDAMDVNADDLQMLKQVL